MNSLATHPDLASHTLTSTSLHQNDWLQDEVRRTEEEANEYETYMEKKTVREQLKVRPAGRTQRRPRCRAGAATELTPPARPFPLGAEHQRPAPVGARRHRGRPHAQGKGV